MQTIRTFVVVPSIPEKLKKLKEIANNMWWVWDHDAIDLFRRLDSQLWEECYHSPVLMLSKIDQSQLERAVGEPGFMAHYKRACVKHDEYMNSACRFEDRGTIAYFSAEFGLHESLPIYSGGLGILAGDHLKSASDLGLNLVGVGLLYRQGYFRQYLNADGWQQEAYPENDFYNMPVTLMVREDGRPIRFHVRIVDRDVVVQVWRVAVGRVSLYLLDTNLRCNRIEDRQITSQLYGGDSTMRIRQEIVLGIGGFTALKCLGVEPAVCHMNEGHAAFMALERIRRVMEEYKMTFNQAREATRVSNVFTTHTPVPAGHDAFSPSLMEKHFSDYFHMLGIDWDTFIALGRTHLDDSNAPFSMTNLALHLSSYRNGVSQLHGEVSRQMCSNAWPGVPVEEIPIGSITNGIHVRTWISRDMAELYDRYFGLNWYDSPHETKSFRQVSMIPDEELWRTHERRRERLVAFARTRLREQLRYRGAGPTELARAEEALDPEALTIGFARRFATYKRGTLLFQDLERFANILTNKDRPVQVIFAGKAHPRDTEGKDFIRKIIHFLREEPFRRHVVFLENYDMNVARHLVQGVDVWLNTPRRGMEASGTSGMKVLSNGGLNLSILDGWWCEGYSTEVGWAIGRGESYMDRTYEDQVESHALYNLLENDVIPLFYERSSDRLPRGWIRMMKNSIEKITPVFSTSRMVSEYAQKFYLPAAERSAEFTQDSYRRAIELADWKDSIRDRWNEVSVGKVDILGSGELQVGNKLEVRTHIKLGNVDPRDVVVEMYEGLIDASDGRIHHGRSVPMEFVGAANDGYFIFKGLIPCIRSGLCGFAVRVVPCHADMCDKYDLGLIRWEELVDESVAMREKVHS